MAEYNEELCKEKHKNIDDDIETISEEIKALSKAVRRLEVYVIVIAVLSKIDLSIIPRVLAGW